MFEGAGTMGVGEAAAAGMGGTGGASRPETRWRQIDRQLRRVANRHAALDAEEMRWLALAQDVELHRELGMATMVEYVERVLGYGPKVGYERLRVARELTELPQLAEALAQGRIGFSAVRELTRKVTAATEWEWLEATRGKCLREVEDMLSGHKKGDRPGDPIDPDLRIRRITLDLTPPTMALFRDASRRLEEELGHRLTDDEVIVALCATVLGGVSPRGEEAAAGVPRMAPYQIALTVCPSCDKGWHDAGGRAIAVPDSTIEQAICDAQYIGRTDLGVPVRADQEVPPAVARMVLRRDRGCCQVPGCRSSRWLQIHHIVPRELGGSNDPCNLICLCFAHHQALHQDKISITGSVPDTLVFDLSAYDSDELVLVETRADPSDAVPVEREEPEPARDVETEAQAHQALVKLGFNPTEVRAAIARARPHAGRGDLDSLVRRCLSELVPPQPRRAPS